jgi:putative ATPase
LQDKQRGLGELNLEIAPKHLQMIADAADGDARQALTLLEICSELAEQKNNALTITDKIVTEILKSGVRRFDKGGESFYDQISALHKSVRGSDPDAALYWFCRMIDGGCDPLYIARRVVRMASEDIGNADPKALSIALDAWDVLERLGSPEGELALAQAIVYLSVAAKSNAVYTAFSEAMTAAKNYGSLEVPLHIRNAPTKLMKQLDYGKTYRYAHDEPEGYAAGENYFPEGMPKKKFYQPVDRGLEIKIKEKLAHLKELDQKYKNQER